MWKESGFLLGFPLEFYPHVLVDKIGKNVDKTPYLWKESYFSILSTG